MKKTFNEGEFLKNRDNKHWDKPVPVPSLEQYSYNGYSLREPISHPEFSRNDYLQHQYPGEVSYERQSCLVQIRCEEGSDKVHHEQPSFADEVHHEQPSFAAKVHHEKPSFAAKVHHEKPSFAAKVPRVQPSLQNGVHHVQSRLPVGIFYDPKHPPKQYFATPAYPPPSYSLNDITLPSHVNSPPPHISIHPSTYYDSFKGYPKYSEVVRRPAKYKLHASSDPVAEKSSYLSNHERPEYKTAHRSRSISSPHRSRSISSPHRSRSISSPHRSRSISSPHRSRSISSPHRTRSRHRSPPIRRKSRSPPRRRSKSPNHRSSRSSHGGDSRSRRHEGSPLKNRRSPRRRSCSPRRRSCSPRRRSCSPSRSKDSSRSSQRSERNEGEKTPERKKKIIERWRRNNCETAREMEDKLKEICEMGVEQLLEKESQGWIRSAPADIYYSRDPKDLQQSCGTEKLAGLCTLFEKILVKRGEKVRAKQTEPCPEPRPLRARLCKHLCCPSSSDEDDDDDDDDDDDSGSDESSDEENDSMTDMMEELQRKQSHPYRLHRELWYNDAGEMNDGPLCRCSAKARRSGIRHGFYAGEKNSSQCNLFSNNASRLYHYRITISPPTNFLTRAPTIIEHDDHEFIFEGFSFFSHYPIPKLPVCKVIRFNIEYMILYVEEKLPDNFIIHELDLFYNYLFKEVLELKDFNLKDPGNTEGCPQFHFMPRFVRELPDNGRELLPMCEVFKYLLRSNKKLIPDDMVSDLKDVPFKEWQGLVDVVKGMVVVNPGMKPCALRVDQLDREPDIDEPVNHLIQFCEVQKQRERDETSSNNKAENKNKSTKDDESKRDEGSSFSSRSAIRTPSTVSRSSSGTHNGSIPNGVQTGESSINGCKETNSISGARESGSATNGLIEVNSLIRNLTLVSNNMFEEGECESEVTSAETVGSGSESPENDLHMIKKSEAEKQPWDGYPQIVHFGIRPPQLSYAGNPVYQRAWREYVKLRHLMANMAKSTTMDKMKLAKREATLQNMRIHSKMKRDVTVTVSCKGFWLTGLMCDVVQHAMLIPVLVSHLRFHRSLSVLEERIGYHFKDRYLLQLAMTHPSYRESFGTNPDHARNSLTNCGIRQPEYGDRRIHYVNTRKRGINTLINIMSKFGQIRETESKICHNERLEFLGDAVVEFITSVHLFHLFSDLEEGGLATYRAALVQNQHLAVLAKKLSLDEYMLYAHGSDLCHDLELKHAMANCFEALMGALFLDGGIPAADMVFGNTFFEGCPNLLESWDKYPPHPLQVQEPSGDRDWIPKVPILQKLTKLEEATGIEFHHIRLLARAFTDRSIGFTHLTLGSNQRLEFLGDSVLQLIASEYLYKYFPEHHEGHLSLLRSSLVNNKTQSVVCDDLGLSDYAIYANPKTDMKIKDRADLVEAYVGALFVDDGLDVCRVFCDVCFFPRLQQFIMNQDWNDPKSKLQQCCLTLRTLNGGEPDIPVYKVVESKGPTNTRLYTVAVYFRRVRLAQASGHSIQQAQMNAAELAIKGSPTLFPQLDHQRRVIANSLKSQEWPERPSWSQTLLREREKEKPVKASEVSKKKRKRKDSSQSTVSQPESNKSNEVQRSISPLVNGHENK